MREVMLIGEFGVEVGRKASRHAYLEQMLIWYMYFSTSVVKNHLWNDPHQRVYMYSYPEDYYFYSNIVALSHTYMYVHT